MYIFLSFIIKFNAVYKLSFMILKANMRNTYVYNRY